MTNQLQPDTPPPIPAAIVGEIERCQKEADKHMDAGAMTLATVDSEGKPTVRTMTVRVIDEQGFVFLTNSQSRKGRDLAINARAALCAYWPATKLQITIEGIVHRLDQQTSKSLWDDRTRENQLAACASAQSQLLADRAELRERFEALKQQYRHEHVPCPENWRAYRLVPDRIEFWRVGWQRLHERTSHFIDKGEWTSVMLQP